MRLLLLALVFTTVVATATASSEPLPPAVSGCDRPKFLIVLDVGHTAEAGGAISARGVSEYELNVRLAKQIEQGLLAANFHNVHVLVMRGVGRSTLLQRSQRANALSASLFLSIHHDSVQDIYLETWRFNGRQHEFSDRYSGYSIFVSRQNRNWERSVHFAKILGDELKSRGMHFTRHHAESIKGERRELIDQEKGIYRYDGLVVLKNTVAPAVLFEAGVIVNRTEELLLTSAAHQSKIGDAVVAAVEAFCASGGASQLPRPVGAHSELQ